MAHVADSFPQAIWTATRLATEFGAMPLHRVRSEPTPGTATIEDVVRIEAAEKRLYELIDGVLLEKTLGYYESILAMRLGKLLGIFVDEHELGAVAGEAGMMRVLPGQLRIPDISFVTWQRLGNAQIESTPVPTIAPDLAVEILSEGNTTEEMDRKLCDYFASGVRLVWYVDAKLKQVRVYTSADKPQILAQTDKLTGGDVLPGFEMDLHGFFAPIQPPAKP